MFKLSLAFLLIFSSSAFADEWSDGDVAREVAYQVVDAVDWMQTRTIADSHISPVCHSVTTMHHEPMPIVTNTTSCTPGYWNHAEMNPLLGAHPSLGKVNNYFALTSLLHVGISHILPSEWRARWQYVTISFESVVVARNFKYGVGLTLPF